MAFTKEEIQKAMSEDFKCPECGGKSSDWGKLATMSDCLTVRN